MRKYMMTSALLAVFLMISTSHSLSAQEVQWNRAENGVGVGIEFGTNYVMNTDGDDGATRFFALDFAFTETLSLGLYREDVSSDDFNDFDITAIQLRHYVQDMLDVGVRIGRAEDDTAAVNVSPYGGVFAAFTPISSTTEAFQGSLNLNLGYDFLPEGNFEDQVKVGLSAVVRF